MNLDTARSAVIAALGRMDSLFNKPVFDEWVLVKLASESGAILAYSGPRAETYQKGFKDDIVLLRAEPEERKPGVGDFDACIRLGPAAYLFCNNTTRHMADIRRDPLWREAQTPFAELSHRFLADPLK
ncbi:MAG: hypothetical protein HYV75_09655 [Opitutae bacterium]|nr:hypothetical protein [Opitutae bacterium]